MDDQGVRLALLGLVGDVALELLVEAADEAAVRNRAIKHVLDRLDDHVGAARAVRQRKPVVVTASGELTDEARVAALEAVQRLIVIASDQNVALRRKQLDELGF